MVLPAIGGELSMIDIIHNMIQHVSQTSEVINPSWQLDQLLTGGQGLCRVDWLVGE